MKTMLSLILAFGLALHACSPASAAGFQNGFVRDGFTFQDGFWWKGGVPHQAISTVRGCNTCFKYQAVNLPKPVSNQHSTVTTHDDHRIVIQNTYNYSQPAATQGSTIFSYSSVADTYGDLDLGAAFNHYGRLAEQLTNGANGAVAKLAGLIEVEGANRKQVAEILAIGQAASQIALAVKPEPGQEVGTQTINLAATVGSDGTLQSIQRVDGVNVGGAGQVQALGTGIGAVISQSCLKCHNAANASGGLNLSNWETLADEDWDVVLERIDSDDPAKRMPKADNGTDPGVPLRTADKRLFFKAR